MPEISPNPNTTCPAPPPSSTNVLPTPTRPHTLNAISPHAPDPTQAAHRAENLAACLRLRDLGMQLAEAAAIRSMAAHDQTQTPQDQTPQDQTPTPQPAAKPADPDLAFARHSRSVRQSVELWERIVNNTFARRPHSPEPTWSEPASADLDPDVEDALPDHEDRPFFIGDYGNLYEAVAKLALISPTYAAIPETLTATIEETLTAHPDDHLSLNFARVCETFGITPDRTLLQPHLESQLRPPPDRTPKLE